MPEQTGSQRATGQFGVQPCGDVALEMERSALLHASASERDLLLAQNELLRSANENLLLATLDAQDLRDEAEATNQRQNEFLAMLAHELRNPLAPISFAGAMLGKIASPSPQLLHVQKIIARQVAHLSRLLDDLLDAARINSGKIALSRSTIPLAEQLVCAAETVQERIDERGQRLELHLPSDAIFLDADPVRLAQVFSNLLVNASKFTQDGGKITLCAWLAGDVVKITVADNGAGIPAEVIPSIFSLFTQGPRTLARSEGGLGVGLNVVRNIVEMHGGTVEVSSEGPGHGSVFTLTLPILPAPAPREAAIAQKGSGQRSLRILLVEDNLDASEVLRMFLQSEGHSVVTSPDGVAGLAAACTQDFDVLICDIGLPGMDGYEVIASLRAGAKARIPYAVATSGYSRPEDKDRALAAGFQQYLVKPIDVDTLLSLISSQAD
ncbi:hybrid sensor histidine kinase/response regulator [Massilia eurypsychrophila]|uniref:histidine kinase n=1 Tax=Massilia eurypsychrophila TaxID=1485217 RepID=A0A2G8T841_9BURK|nr:ATP-binding protein [Massilia eurypsychrophila]PIL42227.1 hybrid sensor histidine kinase/response regulator [Massilia eurypsychrophila]